MPTYIAFLRAINLGRNRKLLMADLRNYLEESGLTGVETYIQTGNVRFKTPMRSMEKVEKHVEAVLASESGFEVPVILFSPEDLKQVYDDADGLISTADPVDGRRYVTFLKRDPPAVGATELDNWDVEGERAKVLGRAVHWMVPGLSQDAKLSNARVEKLVGVGTTRDLKVVTTLAQRWGS